LAEVKPEGITTSTWSEHMKMSRNVGMIETYHWSYVQFFRVVQYSCLLSRMTIQQSTASAQQSIGRVATSVWVERRGIPMSQGGIKKNRGRPFSPLVCARGTSRWPPAEQTENDNQVASIRTACVQAVWNNVAARSIHNERGDTTRWRQQLLSMLCGAKDAGTAGTAALPRRGHGNTAAAGGGGGRHRTLGDGGRLAGVSAAAAGLRPWWRSPRRHCCLDSGSVHGVGDSVLVTSLQHGLVVRKTLCPSRSIPPLPIAFRVGRADLTLSHQSGATMGTDRWPCRCVSPTDRPFDHRRTV